MIEAERAAPAVSPREATWSEMVTAAYDHDRPAAVFGDVSWSGRELLDRAAGAAAWLDSLDLPEGAAVPALVASSPEALALVIGGAGAGHPIAPLGVRMTGSEIAGVVRGLTSPVVVAQPEFSALGREVAHRTGRRPVPVPSFEPGERPLSAGPQDTAVVLHTSGTTGVPKAVTLPQWRLAARARVNGALCDIDPDSVYGGSAPFHHISGLGNVAVALGAGARMTGIPKFTVEGWRLLCARGVTHTTVVPSMLEKLLAAGQLGPARWRVLQYGGAPIRPETLRATYAAVPGVRMLNMFGQTEGSPISVLTPEDHRAAVAGQEELLRSVGRAAPGVELRIDRPGADGVGEVHARGDHLFQVDTEGWLHSGDLGRIAPDGYVYLSGRQSDMIIRGGENVHPQEVETLLATHPEVADAAVVGVPDDRLGQTVAAFVVPADPSAPPESERLRTYVRAELSGFKVPAHWHIVTELPRNANGKVLRQVLRDSVSQ
ncbi:class I adenylate-forming enzyme family protein [Streptomyces gilvus]|uniref:class I adenylate-forming enzyme family protein n=1 Tax=Streptomyces gilvus TaxID=2920937 RepID=UPI001F0F3472|nr:class I adenylate-forming enzyme family protein [Streptomyces sp. CME 23]MCH5675569.1 acyl--CoA ligase [Streptomyces sp. CME 23]